MSKYSYKSHGRKLVLAVLGVVISGIMIMWSWNTLAVELFNQTEMEWRHAVAAVLLIVTIGGLLGLSSRDWREGES